MKIKKTMTAVDVAALLIDANLDFEYYHLSEAFCIDMPYGDQDRIVYSSIYSKWFIAHDGELEPLTQLSFDAWKYFAQGGCTE